MKHAFRQQIVDLLNQHRIMTIATNREDGWPQATVVSYASDGLVIYCRVARDGQKFANIMRDPRVSLAIAKDVPQPLQIKGLSLAASVVEVTDPSERDHAAELLLQRYPEYKVMPRPRCGADAAADAGNRLRARLFQGLRPHRLGAGHRQRSCRIRRGAPASLGRFSRGLAGGRVKHPCRQRDRRTALRSALWHKSRPRIWRRVRQ
jgi:Pyridoxamine 5'-phosphate oxidase